MRASRWLSGIHALLLCTGATGLVYEVGWSRTLGLWLGRGERGEALIVATFFLGMAAGYALASPLTSRVRALRAYGVCELGVGAAALGLPTLAASLSPDDAFVLWLGLLVPTLAMGASLPFALEAIAAGGGSVARGYAYNLVGATAGCLSSTFVLIERAGVWRSTQLAACVSLVCGGVAIVMDRGAARATTDSIDVSTQPVATFATVPWHLASAVAGALTLGFQVLVLRLFALTFHNSTYTFGLTLAVFMLCLAAGSAWCARRVQRGDVADARRFGARGALLAAVGVLVSAPLFGAITRFGILRAPSFASYVWLSGVLVAIVLALPVIGAGTLLPALFSAARASVGARVGSLSAVNGIGAALGALGASFVVLPKLGLFPSLALVAVLYALLSLVFSGIQPARIATVALTCALAAWSAGYRGSMPPGRELLTRWETPHGWLDLVRDPKDQSVSAWLDLHYRLGSSADRARHVLMGELPLVLHPEPRRALFIGLATGMTVSSIRAHPSVRHVEVVELIRETMPLARRFGDINGHVLDDARVHVIIDDGRAHLTRTRERFDVVVADLLVPWHSHSGYLYTVEHYRAVRARLAPKGVFAQWLPLWMLGREELELIANSFSAVFAHSHAFLHARDATRPLLAFVGSDAPLAAGVTGVEAEHLGRFRARPSALLNTDAHPRVEFRAPRTQQNDALLEAKELQRYARARFGARP